MNKHKDNRTEINITNNFNAPIGQHINHVDTINFRMDGDGTFHFEKVENIEKNVETAADNIEEQSMEKKIKRSIDVLLKEKVLKNLYDYTWVMETMNQTKGLLKFNTPSSFIVFLKDIGIERLPSEDSINRKQNTFSGVFPHWEFTDCDTTEATRRINVGKRFFNLFRNS